MLHWLFVAVAILASLASPTTGVIVSLVAAAVYVGVCAARRRRAPIARLALILLSPLIGLIAGAVLFLLGPGY